MERRFDLACTAAANCLRRWWASITRPTCGSSVERGPQPRLPGSKRSSSSYQVGTLWCTVSSISARVRTLFAHYLDYCSPWRRMACTCPSSCIRDWQLKLIFQYFLGCLIIVTVFVDFLDYSIRFTGLIHSIAFHNKQEWQNDRSCYTEHLKLANDTNAIMKSDRI